MTTISGWGRYPIVETDLLKPRTPEAARIAVSGMAGGIARGNGRAYGDAGIGARQTIQMGGLDRIRIPSRIWLGSGFRILAGPEGLRANPISCVAGMQPSGHDFFSRPIAEAIRCTVHF